MGKVFKNCMKNKMILLSVCAILTAFLSIKAEENNAYPDYCSQKNVIDERFLQLALSSSKDKIGIPTNLYELDKCMKNKKIEIDRLNLIQKDCILGGYIGIGIGLIGIATGAVWPPETTDDRSFKNKMYALSGIVIVCSIPITIIGHIQRNSMMRIIKMLQTYFDKNYQGK